MSISLTLTEQEAWLLMDGLIEGKKVDGLWTAKGDAMADAIRERIEKALGIKAERGVTR